jgi:hypothetical protein
MTQLNYITAEAYRSMFTDAELAAMVSSTDVNVKVLVLKVQTTQGFTWDNPSVAAGLDYLVSKGILTPARRAQFPTVVLE